MQVLNKYFGGSIEKDATTSHIKKNHEIEITKDDFSQLLNTNSILVNSFHKNLIKQDELGKNLESFALSKDDKTVEGFFHKTFHIVGVMWHPERDPNTQNEKIFRNLFLEK